MEVKPVLVMAGGTGGHVFPALAVAERLRELGVPLLWLGTARGLEARVVPEAGFQLVTLPVGGFRGKGLMRQILAPLGALHALFRCLGLFLRKRPGAVLGLGGYASGPGGLAAWLLRIPLVIHEQNAVPGLTNRILAHLATRILESFPGSFRASLKAVHTGNPVRHKVLAVPAHGPARAPEGLRLLVLGGSQGASILNRVVPAALVGIQSSLAGVWHQSGAAEQELTQKRYAELGVPARVEAFIAEIASAYGWADLALCRAGASTLFELCAAGLPAILVPYPHAVDDHQTANARYLAARGAAILLPQPDLEEDRIAALIEALARTPERLRAMAAEARRFAMPAATEAVAEHCLEAARG